MSILTTPLAALAWKSALLLGIGFGLAFALRRSSAATRHLAWALTFGAVLLLPAVAVVVPEWGILPGIERADVGSVVPGTEPVVERTAPDSPTDPRGGAPLDVHGEAGAGVGSGIGATGDGGASVVRRGEPVEPAGASERFGDDSAPVTGGRALDPVGGIVAEGGSGGWAGAAGTLGFGFILILWATGVAVRLAVLALGVVRVSWLARRSRPLADPAVLRLAARVSAELGLSRTPRIMVGETAPVPMTWGLRSPRILLPEQALEWPAGRLRRVLLHECAHIARRDLAAQWVAELVCALHWFDPLAWAAAARMRIEREHASDDAVLALGVRPSDYAGDLLDVVRGFDVPPVLAGAAAMARPSQLGERMRAILDPDRRRGRTGLGVRTGAVLFAVALLVSTASAAPARSAEAQLPATAAHSTEGQLPAAAARNTEAQLPAAAARSTDRQLPVAPLQPIAQEAEVCPYPPEGVEPDPEYGVWITEDGGRVRGTITNNSGGDDRVLLIWTGRACTVRIQTHPEVRFTADETDVEWLPRGAEFTVTHRTRDWTRELVVRADGSRSYRVDGRDAAIDAAVRDWTAGIVLTVLRRTGFQHAERSARILDRSGWPGLRREIEAISQSWVAARYLGAGFAGVSTESERREVLALAGERLERDYAWAKFLESVASEPGLSPTLRGDVIAAVRGLDGDYHAGQVFEALLRHQELSPSELMAVVEAADAELEGDYQMGEIYGLLLADEGLDREGARRLIASAAARLEGDYHKQQLLIAVGARDDLGPWVVDEVLEATALLEGDHARGEVLSTFVTAARDTGALRNLLGEITRFDGDYGRAQLLAEIADAPAWSEELRPAWLEAVSRMDGYHMRELTIDFLASGSATEPMLRSVIASAVRTGGYDGARLMVAVAETGRVTDDLRDAFLEAASGFDEYEENRILAALVRR